MMDALAEELARVGLHLNASKARMLTTECLEAPLYVDVADGMIEVLHEDDCHKYLGRHLPGNLRNRGAIELNHRIAAAWGKFHKHRSRLMNKDVSL